MSKVVVALILADGEKITPTWEEAEKLYDEKKISRGSYLWVLRCKGNISQAEIDKRMQRGQPLGA
jgi:hypothetical protein